VVAVVDQAQVQALKIPAHLVVQVVVGEQIQILLVLEVQEQTAKELQAVVVALVLTGGVVVAVVMEVLVQMV
jgi:hypothetical protein